MSFIVVTPQGVLPLTTYIPADPPSTSVLLYFFGCFKGIRPKRDDDLVKFIRLLVNDAFKSAFNQLLSGHHDHIRGSIHTSSRMDVLYFCIHDGVIWWKQSWGWRFETPGAHYDVTVIPRAVRKTICVSVCLGSWPVAAMFTSGIPRGS